MRRNDATRLANRNCYPLSKPRRSSELSCNKGSRLSYTRTTKILYMEASTTSVGAIAPTDGGIQSKNSAHCCLAKIIPQWPTLCRYRAVRQHELDETVKAKQCLRNSSCVLRWVDWNTGCPRAARNGNGIRVKTGQQVGRISNVTSWN